MAANATVSALLDAAAGGGTGTILGGVAVALSGLLVAGFGAKFFGGKYCGKKPEPVRCTACQKDITECPHCGANIVPEQVALSPAEEKLREMLTAENIAANVMKASRDPRAFANEMRTVATRQMKEIAADPNKAMRQLRAPVAGTAAAGTGATAPRRASIENASAVVGAASQKVLRSKSAPRAIAAATAVAATAVAVRPRPKPVLEVAEEEEEAEAPKTTALEVDASEVQDIIAMLQANKKKMHNVVEVNI